MEPTVAEIPIEIRKKDKAVKDTIEGLKLAGLDAVLVIGGEANSGSSCTFIGTRFASSWHS